MENFNFRIITEKEFEKLESTLIFSDKNDRSFGEISFLDKKFKFSWHSEIVLPIIKQIDHNAFGIGIDLNFVLIDLNKREILLNLKLDNYFMDFVMHNENIYVAAQTYIIQIEIKGCKIIKEYGLPEFFNEFILEGNTIRVQCIDNEIVDL
ncbi:hypothetical protein E6C50_08195 [Flavobacterium supellecticarium]|uniref:Uncharacterized protein n=1 Tax=Flavobacterium supellecticarium TaxID=2565924 RepID=A0A4V3W8M0_9FLAO|nr:hypothetical protein [Flavobacterium supellecticarium]THF51730.1 hypothetical protein E6C50_08195 [Flavobacterium supellecticarium]